ncbi:MAG: hypothetical protein REI94_14870 [Moraxellaceae bacterium]|nr:hypothetical protein [Moraxellaceae bacterium]
MRPRIAFAVILALGAVTHLALMLKPPPGWGYLALYLGWLVPSAVVALFLRGGSAEPPPSSARRRGVRQAASSGVWMEGLGLFVGIAAVGLVIHVFGPYREHGRSWRDWDQGDALAMMFALCAAGCWGLLRGEPGDKTAPIPDDSMLVRVGGWLRRLAGIAISCWGAWLFILGIRHWGESSDGFDRLMNLAFVIGGPLWFFIGLALARRSRRSAAAEETSSS